MLTPVKYNRLKAELASWEYKRRSNRKLCKSLHFCPLTDTGRHGAQHSMTHEQTYHGATASETAVLSIQAYTQRSHCTMVFPGGHVHHTQQQHIQITAAAAKEGYAGVQTLQALDQPVRQVWRQGMGFGDRVWELTLFVRSKAAVSRYRSRESAGLSRHSLIHSSILFCSSKELVLLSRNEFESKEMLTHQITECRCIK